MIELDRTVQIGNDQEKAQSDRDSHSKNRVGSIDNFNFRGVPSFLQVCEKRSQAIRKKDGMFAR